MGKLEIEATTNTPYANIDSEKGIIELKGTSYPEDPVGFYEIILNWIDTNFNTLSQKVEVNVKLEYFNTSTSKCLFKLFQVLGKKKRDHENEITVNWFFREHDEDMQEAGAAYEGISQLPFKLVEL